jgi:hypothetical protein
LRAAFRESRWAWLPRTRWPREGLPSPRGETIAGRAAVVGGDGGAVVVGAVVVVVFVVVVVVVVVAAAAAAVAAAVRRTEGAVRCSP